MKQHVTIAVIFLIMISGVAAFFTGRYVQANVQASQVDTVHEVDTIRIPVPPANIDTLPAVIEMARINARTRAEAARYRQAYELLLADWNDLADAGPDTLEEDSLGLDVPVARGDTITPRGDSVHVEYRFPPVNSFSIDLRPAPVDTTRERIIIRQGYEIPASGWTLAKWGAGGAVIGAALYAIFGSH